MIPRIIPAYLVRFSHRDCTGWCHIESIVVHSFFRLFLAFAGGSLTSDVSEVIGAMMVVGRAAVVMPWDPARKGWGNSILGFGSRHH